MESEYNETLTHNCFLRKPSLKTDHLTDHLEPVHNGHAWFHKRCRTHKHTERSKKDKRTFYTDYGYDKNLTHLSLI